MGEFQCGDDICIPVEWKCDYFSDCEDSSDEINDCICTPSIEFSCTGGGCIKRTWICDGQPDCVDGSDEAMDLCGFTTVVPTQPSTASTLLPSTTSTSSSTTPGKLTLTPLNLTNYYCRKCNNWSKFE